MNVINILNWFAKNFDDYCKKVCSLLPF